MATHEKIKVAAQAIVHGHNPKHAIEGLKRSEDGSGATNSSTVTSTSTGTSTPAMSTVGSASGGKTRPSPMTIPSGGFPVTGVETGGRTPKTPADEAIEFFESAQIDEPIRVYELRLDPDGGPNKDRSVSLVSCLLEPRGWKTF